jgi:hypothetical protein
MCSQRLKVRVIDIIGNGPPIDPCKPRGTGEVNRSHRFAVAEPCMCVGTHARSTGDWPRIGSRPALDQETHHDAGQSLAPITLKLLVSKT